MKFSDWFKERELRELATGTNCIASFSRPVMGMVSRKFPGAWGEDEDKPKKKKRKKKKHD